MAEKPPRMTTIPFGHGRIEYIAALYRGIPVVMQVGFSLFKTLPLARYRILRIWELSVDIHTDTFMSVAIKLWLSCFNKSWESVSIQSDAGYLGRRAGRCGHYFPLP